MEEVVWIGVDVSCACPLSTPGAVYRTAHVGGCLARHARLSAPCHRPVVITVLGRTQPGGLSSRSIQARCPSFTPKSLGDSPDTRTAAGDGDARRGSRRTDDGRTLRTRADSDTAFVTGMPLVRTLLPTNKLSSGYNYDSTSVRRPFDCLSEVIEVTVSC